MSEKIPHNTPRARLAASMSRIFAGKGSKEDGARLLSYLTEIVAAPVFPTPSGGWRSPDAAAFADGRSNLAYELISSGHFDVRNIKEQ